MIIVLSVTLPKAIVVCVRPVMSPSTSLSYQSMVRNFLRRWMVDVSTVPTMIQGRCLCRQGMASELIITTACETSLGVRVVVETNVVSHSESRARTSTVASKSLRRKKCFLRQRSLKAHEMTPSFSSCKASFCRLGASSTLFDQLLASSVMPQKLFTIARRTL